MRNVPAEADRDIPSCAHDRAHREAEADPLRPRSVREAHERPRSSSPASRPRSETSIVAAGTAVGWIPIGNPPARTGRVLEQVDACADHHHLQHLLEGNSISTAVPQPFAQASDRRVRALRPGTIHDRLRRASRGAWSGFETKSSR
jgi:hypothetical protein